MTDLELALESLKEHEGLRTKPYDDRTGKDVRLDPPAKLTIGYGHNLESKGLPVEICQQLLRLDLADAEGEAIAVFNSPFAWADMGDERRAVIIEMAFQLGRSGLSRFVKFLDHARAGRFASAALEMLDSKWAREDSPGRAHTLSNRFRDGSSPFQD